MGGKPKGSKYLLSRYLGPQRKYILYYYLDPLGSLFPRNPEDVNDLALAILTSAPWPARRGRIVHDIRPRAARISAGV